MCFSVTGLGLFVLAMMFLREARRALLVRMHMRFAAKGEGKNAR
jgi:hypothetical protein